MTHLYCKGCTLFVAVPVATLQGPKVRQVFECVQDIRDNECVKHSPIVHCVSLLFGCLPEFSCKRLLSGHHGSKIELLLFLVM